MSPLSVAFHSLVTTTFRARNFLRTFSHTKLRFQHHLEHVKRLGTHLIDLIFGQTEFARYVG